MLKQFYENQYFDTSDEHCKKHPWKIKSSNSNFAYVINKNNIIEHDCTAECMKNIKQNQEQRIFQEHIIGIKDTSNKIKWKEKKIL